MSKKTQPSLLSSVSIASPCHENWDDMTGSAQSRHCVSCKKDVYNISEMTTDEAESFLQENVSGRCIRLYQRADGTIVTKDCGTKTPVFKAQFASFGARMAAVFGLAVGATMIPHASAEDAKPAQNKATETPSTKTEVPAKMGEMVAQPAPKHHEIMGKIAAPRPVQTPTPPQEIIDAKPMMGGMAPPMPPMPQLKSPKKPQKQIKPKKPSPKTK